VKTCTKCHEEKQLEEFHQNKNSDDGYNWRCKRCNCADVLAHRKTPKGKQLHREQMQRYRARNRLKEAMRARLRRAVKRGKVEKTRCALCSELRVEAHHHKGYAPEVALDVVWLCRKHHIEADNHLRRGYK